MLDEYKTDDLVTGGMYLNVVVASNKNQHQMAAQFPSSEFRRPQRNTVHSALDHTRAAYELVDPRLRIYVVLIAEQRFHSH